MPVASSPRIECFPEAALDAASLVRHSAKREEVTKTAGNPANEYTMIVHHRQGAPARRRAPKEVAADLVFGLKADFIGRRAQYKIKPNTLSKPKDPR